jgi:hypothetical protein
MSALGHGTFGFMKNLHTNPVYRPLARRPEHSPRHRGFASEIIAYSFVVAIGSGAAGYYSNTFPIAGYVVLIAGLWFAVWALFSPSGRAVLGNLLKADILLWFILVAAPLAFMIFESRIFTRGTWTSQLSTVTIFFVGSVLGLRLDLRGSVILAVLTVIPVGVALNLFELLVHNNAWSTAPGRSAGWYVNPNDSSATLALFGIIFFAFRQDRYRRYDVLVLSVIFAGILATFSRSGFLLFFGCVFASVLSRQGPGVSWSSVRSVIGIVLGLALIAWLAFSVVLPQLSLTEDAATRLESIEDRDFVKDYGTDRAPASVSAWAMFRESPMIGVGVLSSLDMEVGPHNMMAALAMDMGIAPLLLYVWLILRMTWLGVSSLRDRAAVSSEWLVALWMFAYGFSSHNVIDEPAFVLGLGIAVSSFFGIASNAGSGRNKFRVLAPKSSARVSWAAQGDDSERVAPRLITAVNVALHLKRTQMDC